MGHSKNCNSTTEASSRSELTGTKGSIALEILENAGELIATLDMDGFIVFANLSLREALNIPSSEHSPQKQKLTVVSSGAREPLSEEIMRSTLGQGHWSGECELLSMEGSAVPVFLKTGILHAKNGQACGLCCCSHLLSDRNQDDKQLQLLDLIVRGSEDAMIGKTVHGIIQSWNPAAERIFGYSFKQIVGKSEAALLPHNRKAECTQLMEKIRRGEPVHDFETTRLRSDRTPVYVSLSIRPILDDSGEVVGSFTIARDISQNKEIEKQLKHAQRLESVGRLAGGLAHEFNNALSVILGYSELALDKASKDQQLGSFLEQIRRSTHRASSITRQLLAFSQRQVREPVVMDLEASLTQIHQVITRLIGDDIEVEVKGSSEPQRILADPGQIEQMILSLTLRARDAMPRGGRLSFEAKNLLLATSPSDEISGFVPGEYCLLRVSDTGVGLSEVAKKHIFEPHDFTSGVGKILGFDLALVPSIVKQSGGYIFVKSELGRGAAFNIYFPRAEQEVTKTLSGTESGELPRGRETILIVDDDESLRRLTKLILSSLGYSVLEASSGVQAMTIMEHFPLQIHLLLADVIMPGMNGRELAAKCVGVRPELEVLLTSGYTAHLLNFNLGSECASNLLTKPFSRATLAYQVRKTLDEKTSHAAMAAERDQVDSFTA